MSKYAVNIGLEVHIQLNTRSKAFCNDSIEFGQPANTHISPISLAYPGTLPRINESHIEKAIQLALALGCTINEHNYFDRKSYFYPDLPKGYQITQDNAPYCRGGSLEIEVAGQKKSIQIHHIHMEEDAGKSIHDLDPKNTMIDLNRAGTPLLELVTEPTITSADEAFAFLTELRSLVRYLGVSDGNMEEGSMRADCNVSIRPHDSEKMGERREVKNVNSIRFAKKAIEYEIKMQTAIVERGEKVIQSTMDYDPVANSTRPLRDKEDAHDYRYFPDPDLAPLVLSEEYISSIKVDMPPAPWEVQSRLIEAYKLTDDQAKVFTYDRDLLEHFESAAGKFNDYGKLANFYLNKIIPQLQEGDYDISELPISIDQITSLLQLIEDGKVSNSIAYQRIYPELIHSEDLAQAIAEKLDLLIESGKEEELEQILWGILDQFPDKVDAYRKGKKGLMGFFMGQAMKAAKGKLDPKTATTLFQKLLDNQ